MKFAEVTSVTDKRCSKSYPRGMVKDEMICAYSGIFGTGTCLGDSGGPLISDDKLIGIVSFAKVCAIGYPDGYTRISKYVDWLDQVMSEELKKIEK